MKINRNGLEKAIRDGFENLLKNFNDEVILNEVQTTVTNVGPSDKGYHIEFKIDLWVTDDALNTDNPSSTV